MAATAAGLHEPLSLCPRWRPSSGLPRRRSPPRSSGHSTLRQSVANPAALELGAPLPRRPTPLHPSARPTPPLSPPSIELGGPAPQRPWPSEALKRTARRGASRGRLQQLHAPAAVGGRSCCGARAAEAARGAAGRRSRGRVPAAGLASLTGSGARAQARAPAADGSRRSSSLLPRWRAELDRSRGRGGVRACSGEQGGRQGRRRRVALEHRAGRSRASRGGRACGAELGGWGWARRTKGARAQSIAFRPYRAGNRVLTPRPQ
ncbi:hypothetical protein PVAP13_6NG240706 [Panicum virgatum]|uniref:Uncharacterized protein n=1 Tax=Panicum virgatum TaxID=38727 RepID=A0A8T0R2F8_PANVG|nr:hypothetical protein PVAP13_6NG240706 [Panicum virgatum]